MTGKSTIAPFNALQNWEKWETRKALKPNQVAVFGVRGNKFVLLKTDDPIFARMWAIILKIFRVIKSDTNAQQNLYSRTVSVLKTPQVTQLISTISTAGIDPGKHPTSDAQEALHKKAIESLVEEKNKLDAQIQSLKTSHQADLYNLEEKVKNIDAEKLALETVKAQLNSGILTLQKDIFEKEKLIGSLEDKTKKLSGLVNEVESKQAEGSAKNQIELYTVKQDLALLQDKLEESQNQAEEQAESLKVHNARMAEKLLALKTFIENDNTIKNEKIASLEREVEELLEQINILEPDNIRINGLVTEYKRELADANLRMKDQLDENLKMIDTVEDLKLQLDSAESKALKALDEKAGTEMALEKLRKELEIANQNTEHLKEARSAVDLKLDQIKNPATEQFKQHLNFLTTPYIAKKLMIGENTHLENILKACYKEDEKKCQGIILKARSGGLTTSLKSSRGF